MAEHVVASTAEIPDRGRKVVMLEGRSIGVFNIGGRFFAIRNNCAHQGGPVCDGKLFPRHLARVEPDRKVTEYLDHDNPVLCCPWHGWEYDIESGVCLADKTRRVAVYPVRVRDGRVVVELRS